MLFGRAEMTQKEIVISLRETIKARPEYVNGLIDKIALDLWRQWVAAHPRPTPVSLPEMAVVASPRAATASPSPVPVPSEGELLEGALFEMVPVAKISYRVTPTTSKALLSFTEHDLDAALHILQAKHENSLDGGEKRLKNLRAQIEREKADFMEVYNRFHPMLGGQRTIADVIRDTASG